MAGSTASLLSQLLPPDIWLWVYIIKTDLNSCYTFISFSLVIGSTVPLVGKLGHFIVSDMYTTSFFFAIDMKISFLLYLLCHWSPGLHFIATLFCILWFSKKFLTLRSMSSLNFLVSFSGLPRILWIPWNSVHIVKWVFIFESHWYLDRY